MSAMLATQQPFFPFANYIVYYSVNIGLFYAHAYVLTRTFTRRRAAYWTGAGLFLLNFLFFLTLKVGMDLFINAGNSTFAARIQSALKYLPLNVMRNCYLIILSTFYWVGGNIAGYRRKAEASEKAELLAQKETAELGARFAESRNAYLQQQVNPHMLFNALGFIHTHVYRSSPDAAHCVWLLSDILRFGLDAAEADGKASVAREAEQLGHLLEINRFRFDGALHIRVEIANDLGSYRIIPMILLTLAENMFKHGDLRNAEAPALLRLEVNGDGRLLFRTRNRKKAVPPMARNRALGLQNTRLRLDFAYPGGYTLTTKDEGGWFELELAITLN
ncbi:hypothetical protein BC343_27040 [Mucilaginibacter pedocola]|uniref:Signal transduction histidine kinase internal region domain-containing protein n=2 Tax=Mucilaginibacter pedocola TaxID=1792845 RepID=A0A1S9PGC2_9SPHI|nr:hypothetical protein BC343_27040 [Mucilaginibacter pedocola]